MEDTTMLRLEIDCFPRNIPQSYIVPRYIVWMYVPQSSVLGELLFNVSINDIYMLSYSKFHLHADGV